jgi:hypothetical protein
MFPRRFLIAGVVALVILGLIVSGITASVQRNAWMQGYLMGRLESGSTSGGSNAAPLAPYLYGYRAPYGGGGGFGWLGVILVVFLLFAGLRVLRCAVGYAGGGPGGRRYGPGQRHGHRPPWWGWDEPAPDRPDEDAPSPGPGGQA